MWSGLRSLLLLCFVVTLFQTVYAANNNLQFIEHLPADSNWVLLDSRSSKQCLARSLPGARCLSIEDILSPGGQLPSLRDISWLLGTHALRGDETVIVAGNPGLQRNFMAGLLYLAGQHKVYILSPPLGRVLASGKWEIATGRAKAMSRQTIYTAAPRDKQIILRDELWQLILTDKTVRVLDGRSEDEYWGQLIRGFRGGHIPGAELFGKQNNQTSISVKTGVETIFYAHDPLETIGKFVKIQSRNTNPIRVFIDGWRTWAINNSLPVDAESFYDSAKEIRVLKNDT
jgi:thiosulfate/3-mercaptopyruvate sulfurtransferase